MNDIGTKESKFIISCFFLNNRHVLLALCIKSSFHYELIPVG